MGQPRIRIRFKDENVETSKKLSFSSHSREEARKRINEENTTESTFLTTNIYEQLFKDDREAQKLDHHETAGRVDEEERLNQENQIDHKQERLFPPYSGFVHHPLWPTETQWREESRDWRMPSQWEDDSHLPEEEYIPPRRSWDDDRFEERPIDPIYRDSIYREMKELGDEKQAKQSSTSIIKIIASILAAVILGSLFGWLLLIMLLSGSNSQVSKDASLIPEGGSSSTQIVPFTDVDFDLAQGSKNGIKSGSLMVSDRTFYVIQGGAFAEERSAQQAMNENRNKNIPAMVMYDDKHLLFLGITYKHENAVDLANYFQNRGKETYVKEFMVAGGTIYLPEAKMSEMEVLNNFFIHGTYLLEKTAAWGGDGVKREVSISQEDWNKYKDTHRRFLEESKQVMQFLPEYQQQWVDQMSTNMNVAVTGLVEYLKQPEINYLLESQQALLHYFNGYRELLKSFGIKVSVN